jgi:phosphatidylserine decarboxylase
MDVIALMKIAPEGLPFIFVTALFAVLAIGLCGFMFYFFRDPERHTPDRPDAFICPADGKILLIRQVETPSPLGKPCLQISIFMSPFNVHVNRAPCDGTVSAVAHHDGRYFAAYKEEASVLNENTEMTLTTAHGPILVRQVAGFLARRTVCRVHPGDTLKQGQRFGIIRFGSRVDLYLPEKSIPSVKPGDVVRAGETIVAVLPPAS